MREVFSSVMLSKVEDPSFVFLSGDLGFNALEELQRKLALRFINAGVAEQNMVGVAAGLASKGFHPWVYSIAPFVYARPFEQIRNDVCLHHLPVSLVGNGGGFGYGVMGATHHALEDYGILCTLPGMKAYIPSFDEDLAPIAELIKAEKRPSYLRLGRSELKSPLALPAYSALRQLKKGDRTTLLAVGPLVGGFIELCRDLPERDQIDIWSLTEFPLVQGEQLENFIASVSQTDRLVVVEEHVASGSVGQALATMLLERELAPSYFRHHCVKGYLSKRYGSQNFHRQENLIDANTVLAGVL